ncbi:uncharacterized protein LOC129947811 [Eupeodes corollae]|uniref:uncharacterized protein LOC129947811 n=1 Tax=Eupeodes corollae TaxID=290404 RepID=UPI002492693F|nr:uncharacterized protein LOC129947811 [Eupeodes corollae]
MRNSLIVDKIFAETLNFLLISSIGYPNCGYQTNAMNTSNEFLTSTSTTPSYTISTTIASLSQLRRANNNLDKKHFNDSSTLNMITYFDKEDNSTKLMNSQPMVTDIISIKSTASPVFNNSKEAMLNNSMDLISKNRISTTSPSFPTTNISTIKPAISKNENKLTLPKFQKTDAPMLNYIFDMFSTANKHHHHDQRYGPHFEDIPKEGNPTNITVQAGASVFLNCRISLLQDKTVSWVRRNSMGEDALELLTVGLHTYTGDKRYTMEFQYPNNWRLKITNAKKEDEATYECQISTHPPRVIQIHLSVNAPKVVIVDEYSIPLQEKYYEIDSTLQLSCTVRNVVMTSSVVFWRHGDQILNYDTTRGGVSVRTDLMEDGANSTLSIARVNKQDSGNYTCSISDSQDYTIIVHILKGESFAELHHGAGRRTCDHYSILLIIITLSLILSNTNNKFR